ncbi:mediator of RNA polymerase II transcription subunit 25 isoform X3 [Harpegnathos saltator]|uniref:mediator of RNA polymerase II transcription subunit 25 isoform X3 n=1 Tax=Harpegnathos saltator TaxID=610380 RepID=UPI000DBEEFB4|nr:mediator of RNA polymerase II transcription subunit 25 isoform X3 [Harpegnathos saltator]
MVTGPTDQGMQADVIFVIEGTAVNSAYLNDLKASYIIPTLEYFNQGGIEDREYISEQNSTTLYGIVVYHAADCLPAPSTETFGPYTNPHKVLVILDKLEMVGGKGESYANIGEGLATGLQCFEDLQLKREPNTASQKHCILICNSPPYQIMIQECYKFAGHTIEQLATIYQERNINISILSPRKIPALFKLFEKAGGDLQSSQKKNYAKDPRHLVLLRNYNLKERPVSPATGGNVHNTTATAAQIPLSPLQSNDSPNTNQVQQNIAPPSQPQGSPFRNQTPQNITSVHQTVTSSMAAPMNTARPPYNSQIAAPPNYHPTSLSPRTTHTRWMRPFIAPGTTAPTNAQNSSALIAQLTQPPSLGLNVATFGQRLDGGNNVMAPNPQQQQQLTQQQQQQMRLTMQLQQQNAQQATMSMNAQPTHSQPGSQLTVSCMSQSVPTQVPQTVTASQAPVSVSSVTQQIAPPQTQGNVSTVQGPVQGQQLVQRERQNIWQGILEWIEKAKNPTDAQKQTRHVPCQVSANSKDGDPELKADTWPPKLIMQLMPKQLIGNIGSSYLKNSKSVIFHPTPCEALESLTKMMSAGFAGCVHFTSVPPSPACEIKVLILLYTLEKKSYLGFIPNDQTAFVDSLRKVIQQQKTSHASMRHGQANPGPGNTIPAPMPTTGTQGGILMSQTNTMAMGGGQITQNVISNNTVPQTLSSTVPQTQINMQVILNSGISGPQANAAAGGMITQQRPPFDDLEIARHQNLLKIQHLRQTLEAAQQQEAQYKSQLEVNIQQNLEVAQQQEMQYKQQLEAQQAQRGLNPAAMANQQANTQRLMRPVSASNLGLRHLLQQPQSQYRQQVFGVQQQMVGPRGQLTRPMAPGNTQNQQFEDVPNDFMSF